MKKKFLPFINRRFAHAPGAAGDFTASAHQAFLLKAEEKWKGGKYEDDLKPHCDSLILQLNRQTARFDELSNPNKDNTVTLTWLKSCGIETTDLDRSTDICTISGTELESDSKEYEYTLDRKIGFTIDAEKLRTDIYEREDQVAHIMMKADKQLSEWLTVQYLTALATFAGPNIPVINGDITSFSWDDADTTTNVPEASYDIKMVAKLVKMMQLNQVEGGFYINRGSLFEAWVDAGYDTANAEGKGDGARKAAVAMEFDMWNFSKAAITEDMFLISNNAVAVKTYTRHPDKPEIIGGNVQHTIFRMKSQILPNTYYDVIYQLTCASGHYKHTWQFMTKAGVWLNPEACPVTVTIDEASTEVTPTGVYSFTKTA